MNLGPEEEIIEIKEPLNLPDSAPQPVKEPCRAPLPGDEPVSG
jgi:hypothetical protein